MNSSSLLIGWLEFVAFVALSKWFDAAKQKTENLTKHSNLWLCFYIWILHIFNLYCSVTITNSSRFRFECAINKITESETHECIHRIVRSRKLNVLFPYKLFLRFGIRHTEARCECAVCTTSQVTIHQHTAHTLSHSHSNKNPKILFDLSVSSSRFSRISFSWLRHHQTVCIYYVHMLVRVPANVHLFSWNFDVNISDDYMVWAPSF